MKLVITSTSGEPIYAQIKRQIRSAVLSGDLSEGESLPSLRRLARELRVSVLTVTRAYNELASEGVVQNIQGKGTFVMNGGNELMQRQLRARVDQSLREASVRARMAGMSLPELNARLGQIFDQPVHEPQTGASASDPDRKEEQP